MLCRNPACPPAAWPLQVQPRRLAARGAACAAVGLLAWRTGGGQGAVADTAAAGGAAGERGAMGWGVGRSGTGSQNCFSGLAAGLAVAPL